MRTGRAKACRVKGAAGFLRYLTGTLIPDTVEGGQDSMAEDLRAGVAFIRGAHFATIGGKRWTRERYATFIRETLLPDLEESESAYAEDFEEILRYMDECA